MNQGFVIFPTPLASWSRWAAFFSAQLMLIGVILHRFAGLSTPVALNLFAASLAGGLLAILLGLMAYVSIWRNGRSGAWSATAGLAIGFAMLAWPAAVLPFYVSLPKINDVTTDTTTPPRFIAVGKERPKGANSVEYGGAEIAKLQASGYPDIRPMIVPRPANETFDALADIVRRMKWKISTEQAPQGRGKPGFIEAVDRTLVLGFSDDIVLRIDGDARESRVDVRSASRYGLHDFGRNATRVRKLFQELQSRLDNGVGGDRLRRRRGSPGLAVPKRPKGAPVASAAQSKQQGRGQQGSQRAQQQKEKLRSRAEGQARGKRPQQSQE